jgi:O-antigen/teichoic acid export membrane protein
MPRTEIWFRFLPRPLRSRLAGRPNLWRILTNIVWLFGDRFLRLGVGLVLSVWIARYLGPVQFGVLNYAIAFVGLFLPVAMLGLDQVVVRDLVNQPDRRDEILGTAFGLKLLSGFLSLGAAIVVIVLLRPADGLLHLLVVLSGTTLVVQAFDTIDLSFQSQVRSKFPVIARNASFLTVAAIRLALILTAAPLVAFAAAISLEATLTAIGLVGVYWLSGASLRSWRPVRPRAASLLRASWPLMFSGLAIAIYMRIDQVMLGEMLGDEAEVGIYAAAVRISEVWYFIPTAVVSSVAPALIQARTRDAGLYARRVQQLLNSMALLGYAVAIPVTLLAGPMMWLYGAEFAGGGPTLAVHIWAGLFVCLGLAQNAWLLNEGLTRFTLASTVLGAALNIGLNLILIPDYGSLGAAIATLISYGITVAVVCFFYEPTRPIGRMILKAMLIRR